MPDGRRIAPRRPAGRPTTGHPASNPSRRRSPARSSARRHRAPVIPPGSRVAAYWIPRRRSARRRPRSIRLSDAAFHQISAVKITMLVSTNRDSRHHPIQRSPAARPSQRTQPTSAGMRITAGSIRRAMTPPASPLVTTAITPRSASQRMPTPISAQAPGQCSAPSG